MLFTIDHENIQALEPPPSPSYTIEVARDTRSMGTVISLKVDDVRGGLPNAIAELAKMGIDLTATKEALQRAEEQRNLKAKLQEKAQIIVQAPKTRRFVLSCAQKKQPSQSYVTEGAVLDNDNAQYHLITLANPRIPGLRRNCSDMNTLEKVLEDVGYEYYIKFLD